MEKKLPVFIAGLLVGVLSCAGAVYMTKFYVPEFKAFKNYTLVRAGELLDTDMIILKRGEVLVGQIIGEDSARLTFSSSDSIVEYRKDEIKTLHKNYYTRYLKAVL